MPADVDGVTTQKNAGAGADFARCYGFAVMRDLIR